MGKWKKKSPKKLSVRKRRSLENQKEEAALFGEIPAGQKAALSRTVDKFIRESSCRHMQSLASPCASFDAASGGKCKRDGRLCDLLTEKGKRYWREYE
jgi:hypothetical protein